MIKIYNSLNVGVSIIAIGLSTIFKETTELLIVHVLFSSVILSLYQNDGQDILNFVGKFFLFFLYVILTFISFFVTLGLPFIDIIVLSILFFGYVAIVEKLKGTSLDRLLIISLILLLFMLISLFILSTIGKYYLEAGAAIILITCLFVTINMNQKYLLNLILPK